MYCVVKLGYPVSGISDHAESYREGYGSNHSDMGQWLPKHGKSMDALRAEVQAILENKEDEEVNLVQFKELWHQMRKELQDNDSSAYSEQARQWAVENGLIAGNGTTVDGQPNYMWEDVPTREQLITVLFRFAPMMGMA